VVVERGAAVVDFDSVRSVLIGWTNTEQPNAQGTFTVF
jgi:hypothetical protein